MIYTVTLNPALDRELTVPELLFDDVLRATATRVDCGGKGFNVARMLAALGAESVALVSRAGIPGRCYKSNWWRWGSSRILCGSAAKRAPMSASSPPIMSARSR